MDLNFHSVFKVAETDIAEKVEPVISKFLGELEAALKDLGFSHTSSVLTSDQGQKPIVPAPVEIPVKAPDIFLFRTIIGQHDIGVHRLSQFCRF